MNAMVSLNEYVNTIRWLHFNNEKTSKISAKIIFFN